MSVDQPRPTAHDRFVAVLRELALLGWTVKIEMRRSGEYRSFTHGPTPGAEAAALIERARAE